MVVVDYDTLPAIVDWERALDADAPLAHSDAEDNLVGQLKGQFGDIDAAFEVADHSFDLEIRMHRGGCHSMECRGVLARHELLDDKLHVWSSTQTPYMLRRLLSRYLGRAENTLRVAAPDVGGGFGPKSVIHQEEYAVPLAALLMNQPVKWVEDRREHFLATYQQRDQVWSLDLAVSKEGRLLGVRGRCLHDNGAYVPYGVILGATAMGSLPGPYALGALDVTMDIVFTNLVPNTPVRGAGRPNACFVMERLMDKIARELSMDRVEVRRRNLVRADQFPYETGMKTRDGHPITYDSGDYNALVDAALEQFGTGFPERQTKARAEGRYIGLGVACCNEDTGLAPYEGATVTVEPAGKVLLQTGAAAQGQGHATIFAQICADALGLRPEDIRVESADTDKFPLGIGTVGSRVAITGGSSVHLAATEVRDKALKHAARLLDAAEDSLSLREGYVCQDGTNNRISLGEVALSLNGAFGLTLPKGQRPGLSATAYYDAQKTAFASGTNLCEVEVDIVTGHVTVTRYVVAHDCGRLINPMLVDGQIRGGVIHGIGNALFERVHFDSAGQPLTTNYGEYLLPLATDAPRIEIVHLETPSPLNPIGATGAGEGGTIPAAACVISGIEDALAPFGVVLTGHPVSPEDVRNVIDSAKPGDRRNVL